MKTLKTPEQTIKELKEEIKVSKWWLKKHLKLGELAEALEYKHSIATCEFVIELIKGNCD